MQKSSGRWILCFILFSAAVSFSCSKDYETLDTENGRQAALDKANQYLTAGLCDEAIGALTELYNSTYVDNDVRLIYSSAYACKGGLSFPSLMGSLVDSTSDIWSPLVKANYSTGTSDGKITNLQRAATILLGTSSTGGYDASYRTKDANAYMIFVQANIISSVIAPLGNASRTTGKRTQDICAACGTTDQCLVEVAFATIKDSLDHAGSSAILTNIKNSIESACTALGSCPTNKDPSVCTATEQLQGQSLLNVINTQWSQ